MENRRFKPLTKKMKKCFRKLNDLEVKKLLEFANRITPKRWNIFVDHINYIERKGILNIYLNFLQPECYEDIGFEATVHGGLSYANGIGFAHIKFLYPCEWYTWRKIENILIHELAHVMRFNFLRSVKDKYFYFKSKSGNDVFESVLPIGLSQHGKQFQQFHKIMKERAGRAR